MEEKSARNIRLMGWTSFFADVSSEMAYPVIPLFLKNVLKAPAAAVGWTEGVAQFVIGIMAFLSGRRSDKTGNRLVFIRTGYGLAAVAKPLFAAATFWPMVLAIRAMDRFGKGLRGASRDALLADSAPEGQAGKAFGFNRSMDNAGALVGAFLAVVLLLTLKDGYRTIFLLAFLPGLAALILTFRLREVRPVATMANPSEPVRFKPTRAFWAAIACLALFDLGNSSDAFLLLRANDIGLSPALTTFGYMLYSLVAAATALPLAQWSDRVGRIPFLIGGWLIFAVVYGGLAFASPVSVWPLFAVYGVFYGATDGIEKALIRDLVPSGSRGTAMGLFALVRGCVILSANLIAGLLWDQFGSGAPFLFGAATACSAVVLIAVVRPGHRPSVPA